MEDSSVFTIFFNECLGNIELFEEKPNHNEKDQDIRGENAISAVKI
jgi:hypothetical protein